jgi:hypothetical protein
MNNFRPDQVVNYKEYIRVENFIDQLIARFKSDPYLQSSENTQLEVFLDELENKLDAYKSKIPSVENNSEFFNEIKETVFGFFKRLPQEINNREVSTKTFNFVEDWFESFEDLFIEMYIRQSKSFPLTREIKNFADYYNEPMKEFYTDALVDFEDLLIDGKYEQKLDLFKAYFRFWLLSFYTEKMETKREVDLGIENEKFYKRVQSLFYSSEKGEDDLLTLLPNLNQEKVEVFMGKILLLPANFRDAPKNKKELN